MFNGHGNGKHTDEDITHFKVVEKVFKFYFLK